MATEDKNTEPIYGVYNWEFHDDTPVPMPIGREAQQEPWWHLLIYYGSIFLTGLAGGLFINWLIK